MTRTSLVVMAAGIGSRFGNGIKQLEPVGPNGEIIMDYSIYDALKSGFNKVIFIIRKDIENDFRKIIGKRIEGIVDVEYAFQTMDLPNGFIAPKERIKPFGTGQAILSAKDVIHEPFLVINADDYYGRESFITLHDYMINNMKDHDGVMEMCMPGFILANTLSKNGGVTRGVCSVNKDGYLEKVTETYDIYEDKEKIHAMTKDGIETNVSANQYVSMNMFGLPISFLNELEEGFPLFLQNLKEEDIKSEYLLPTIIDQCIQNKKARVRVMETKDKWFGVTYKEDKQVVVNEFSKLITNRVYPKKLF